MRYVRKPIEIDAVVWSGMEGSLEVLEEFAAPAVIDRQANDTLAIHTVYQGTKVAAIGDYVCKDVGDGTVFVVKGEGFKVMYEPIDGEEWA